MTPFHYPDAAHVRRHGPAGYAAAASFRPWLRDEFVFRCVFCLRRETWDRCIAIQVEHFQPVAENPALALDYDNLFYACASCNGAKGTQRVADPTKTLLSTTISIRADGHLEPHTPDARRLIRQLRLDSPERIHFRRIWMEIVRLAARSDRDLHRRLLGFPDDLPDLSSLRPPGGNSRPAGVTDSYFARRQRGELPELA